MTAFLQNFLPYRLNRLSEAMSLQVRPIYKELLGLTRPEWRVLAAIADLGPCSATEVCDHSAQHKTKVSRAVYALSERRWVARAPDTRDRRSEVLTLTEAGQRAYATLIGPLSAREAELIERLAPADRDALLRGLAALEAAVLRR
ncbi:MAG: MarR family winged helix-turn-helix transcriptional regulator [Pseudomonadota bacterium]